jgi:hypothetical protein
MCGMMVETTREGRSADSSRLMIWLSAERMVWSRRLGKVLSGEIRRYQERTNSSMILERRLSSDVAREGGREGWRGAGGEDQVALSLAADQADGVV